MTTVLEIETKQVGNGNQFIEKLKELDLEIGNEWEHFIEYYAGGNDSESVCEITNLLDFDQDESDTEKALLDAFKEYVIDHCDYDEENEEKEAQRRITLFKSVHPDVFTIIWRWW